MNDSEDIMSPSLQRGDRGVGGERRRYSDKNTDFGPAATLPLLTSSGDTDDSLRLCGWWIVWQIVYLEKLCGRRIYVRKLILFWVQLKRSSLKIGLKRVNSRRTLGLPPLQNPTPVRQKRLENILTEGLKTTELPSPHLPLSRAQLKHTNKALTSLSSWIYTLSMSLLITPAA